MRAGPGLLLLVLAGCAGQSREVCGSLSDELRALREKSRECDVSPVALVSDSCGETSICTEADRKLLAAETSCVEHLPACNDSRACRGDACADATPGATADWQKQVDACRRESAALSPGCRRAISRGP